MVDLFVLLLFGRFGVAAAFARSCLGGRMLVGDPLNVFEAGADGEICLFEFSFYSFA